jgi:hypothetical protein
MVLLGESQVCLLDLGEICFSADSEDEVRVAALGSLLDVDEPTPVEASHINYIHREVK